MPTVGLRRAAPAAAPKLRLPPLLQQRDVLVPDGRLVAKMRQFVDLALYGRGLIARRLAIGPAWEITLEQAALIYLFKRHRIHRFFSYDDKTPVSRSRSAGKWRGTAS
jgi:hypothetical protein